MSDFVRRKTRAQGEQDLVYRQSGFLGGMCVDAPAGSVASVELPYIENAIPTREGLHTRFGNRKLLGDISELGAAYSMCRKPSGGFILHSGGYLYNLEIKLSECAFMERPVPGVPDKDSLLEISDNKIYCFTEAGIYRCEMTNGRVSSKPEKINLDPPPKTGFSVSCGSPGSYRYRFTYTAKTLRVETPPMEGYFEVTSSEPISEATPFSVSLSGELSMALVRRGFRFISLWRTLDISPLSAANSADLERNDPTTYHYCGQIDLPLTATDTDGIGSMSIGGTFMVSGATRYDLDFSDDIALSGARVLQTQGFIPLPSSSVSVVTSGFIFVAKGSRVVYSGRGSPYLEGLYQPTYQYLDGGGDVTGLLVVGTTLYIFTAASIRKVSLQSVVNAEGYIPVIQQSGVQIAEQMFGVAGPGCWASLGGGSYVIVCSDGSVRVLSQDSFSRDLAAGKVRSAILKNGWKNACVLRASEDSFYLWLDSGKCLYARVSMEMGSSWCYMSGSGFEKPIPKLCGVVTDKDGRTRTIVISYQHNGVIALCDSVSESNTHLYEDFDGVFPVSFMFRELRGVSEQHIILHSSSYFALHPLPNGRVPEGVKARVSAFIDYKGENSVAETVVKAEGGTFYIAFPDEVVGNRILLFVELNKGGWYIPELESLFISCHSRKLDSGVSTQEIEKEIWSDLLFLLCQGHPLSNSAKGIDRGEIVSGSSEPYIDNGYYKED